MNSIHTVVMKLQFLTTTFLVGLCASSFAAGPRFVIGAEITAYQISDANSSSIFKMTGMSNRGYAVGNKTIVSRFGTPLQEVTTTFAFYRTGVLGIQIIPKLGEFGYAKAIAVNNFNEILGTYQTAAVAFPNGGGTDTSSVNLTNFMTTTGATFHLAGFEPVSINDNGDVLLRDSQGVGFMWPPRSNPTLDQMLFPNSINLKRQVAGAVLNAGATVPAIYNEFNVIEPKPLPVGFTSGRFTRINQWKQCIGYAFNSSQTRYFFWSPVSGYKLLGVGGGSGRMDVRGFNGNGWAVGRVGGQAMLWVSGTDYALTTLMSGLQPGEVVEDAVALSDKNYVLALIRNSSNVLRWVMLEPAPLN